MCIRVCVCVRARLLARVRDLKQPLEINPAHLGGIIPLARGFYFGLSLL